MRAVLSKAPGGPETLVVEEVMDPRPMKGEVVIEVRAVGVNFPDTLIIEDKYQFRPERPFSPGGEISGIVSAVGEGVSEVAVGDRVGYLHVPDMMSAGFAEFHRYFGTECDRQGCCREIGIDVEEFAGCTGRNS